MIANCVKSGLCLNETLFLDQAGATFPPYPILGQPNGPDLGPE